MNLFSRLIAFIKSKLTHQVVVNTTSNSVDTVTTVNTVTSTAVPAEIVEEDVQKAIDLVNNVKTALASPAAVLITTVIPGTIDDTIRVALVDELPVIAAGLSFFKDELSTDKSTALSQVLAHVKLSDQPGLDAFYHTLGAKVLQIVSGGTVSWSKAVIAIEYVLKEAVLDGSVVEEAAAAVAAPAEEAAPEAKPVV